LLIDDVGCPLEINVIQQLVMPIGVMTPRRSTAETYRLYEEEKRAAKRIDFADMLLMPVVSMRESAAVRRRLSAGISHILVDEYQDVNDCQYEFLHLLASGGAKLFCVGDDFQAIYGWRQARVAHIINFCEDHPDATRVTLVKNYRCTPEILAPANRIAAGLSEKLEDKDLEAVRDPGQSPVIGEFASTAGESAGIAAKIAALHDGATPWSDIAVLARTNKALRGVEDELMRRAVPYVVAGGSFWERAEVMDMLAYLEAILDPAADEAFLRIVNVPSRQIGQTSITKLRQAASRLGVSAQSPSARAALGTRTQMLVEQVTAALAGWRLALSEGAPVSSVLAEVLRETGYARHWDKEPETKIERIENVRELIASADGFGSPAELLAHAARCRRQAGKKVKDAVTLSTIHRAKGLEWHTVFLCACNDGAMPHGLAATPDELDEERRLCYVAFTRAARRLYVSFCCFTRGPAEPSPYLDEVADLCEVREGFDAPARAHDGTRRGARDRRADARPRPDWAETLDIDPDAGLEDIKRAYRALAKRAHPDTGGSHEAMRDLNVAYELAVSYRQFRDARGARAAA
jgi:DNA helicase-2/ATP-dependent DNA helicase PcrA